MNKDYFSPTVVSPLEVKLKVSNGVQKRQTFFFSFISGSSGMLGLLQEFQVNSVQTRHWHYSGPDVLSHEEEAELEAFWLRNRCLVHFLGSNIVPAI